MRFGQAGCKTADLFDSGNVHIGKTGANHLQ